MTRARQIEARRSPRSVAAGSSPKTPAGATWTRSWKCSDMDDHALGRGTDPVPGALRRADPKRDRLSQALEDEVEIAIHVQHNDPLDRDVPDEQRVHYVFYPAGSEPLPKPNVRGASVAGFVYFAAGAWFWRPSWAGWENAPRLGDLNVDQEPSVELDVTDEEEAKQHARRRVAWVAAGLRDEPAEA